MVIKAFPPVAEADEYGLLAVGGDTEVESLLNAYKSGIFPWPIEEGILTWFAPPARAVLFLEEFRISKSLQKLSEKHDYTMAVDRDFDAVIEACAEWRNRKGQEGTWITSHILDGYKALHKAGFAHSVECYNGSTLVGGLYAVSIGGFVAGESMFHREKNTSKLSLLYFVEFLKSRGARWIDVQQETPFLRTFGVRSIERDDYMEMLESALGKELNWSL